MQFSVNLLVQLKLNHILEPRKDKKRHEKFIKMQKKLLFLEILISLGFDGGS